MAKASHVLFPRPDLDFLVKTFTSPHFNRMHEETALHIQPCSSPRQLLLNPTTSLQAPSILVSRSCSQGFAQEAAWQNWQEQRCNSHFPRRGSWVYLQNSGHSDFASRADNTPSLSVLLFQCLQVQRLERRWHSVISKFFLPLSGGVLLPLLLDELFPFELFFPPCPFPVQVLDLRSAFHFNSLL